METIELLQGEKTAVEQNKQSEILLVQQEVIELKKELELIKKEKKSQKEIYETKIKEIQGMRDMKFQEIMEQVSGIVSSSADLIPPSEKKQCLVEESVLSLSVDIVDSQK
jgi:hypothetical protein